LLIVEVMMLYDACPSGLVG